MQESVDDTANEVPQLLSIELRVLGALMEKELTTPDQYPLTLNSLISACNQKSSRDPVSAYAQGEIARALTQLEHRKLSRKEFGSRSEKFSQQLIKQLELGKKHQAILCVMMLRGPQTISELNTRTQRMDVFSSREELEHTLDRLCNRELPYAIRLQHQAGQREERFTHLFSGTPANVDTTTATENAPRVAHEPADASNLQVLRQELDDLRRASDALKQQMTRLYHLTGHEIENESNQSGEPEDAPNVG